MLHRNNFLSYLILCLTLLSLEREWESHDMMLFDNDDDDDAVMGEVGIGKEEKKKIKFKNYKVNMGWLCMLFLATMM